MQSRSEALTRLRRALAGVSFGFPVEILLDFRMASEIVRVINLGVLLSLFIVH